VPLKIGGKSENVLAFISFRGAGVNPLGDGAVNYCGPGSEPYVLHLLNFNCMTHLFRFVSAPDRR
jgi:hypothetical protein